MDNKLNNKQKFWLSFTAILMIGLFANSLVIGLSWVNSPTYWSTHHTFDLNSDEYVASSLESISEINTKNFYSIDVSNYCTFDGSFCESDRPYLSREENLDTIKKYDDVYFNTSELNKEFSIN